MRHSCEYYDTMCDRPLSDCLEDCPMESPRKYRSEEREYEGIFPYAEYNPYQCAWDDGCGCCPHYDECLVRDMYFSP